MRIGITGMAMKSSLGDTLEACYQALCRGEDANGPLLGFAVERFNTKQAYEIDDREGGSERTYRASDWLSDVIDQALDESSLNLEGLRCGVFIGTGLRELRSVELWHNDEMPITLDRLHFGGCANGKMPASTPVYTFCNACSASNYALGMALDLLQDGTLDVAVVGGIDSITESMFGLLDRVNPLHPQYLRSLNKDRKGVIMGEGAAAVVLVRDPSVAPQAWVRGVGVSCDAYQETAPDQDGLVAAMRDASERAGLDPTEIDLLFVHGTGTILNDQVEMKAVREFFGEHAEQLLITGVKPSIGHTSGASGLISTIIAARSLIGDKVPAIFGLHDPIDETENLQLLDVSRAAAGLNNVQINAFGFGGVNAVAIVSRA